MTYPELRLVPVLGKGVDGQLAVTLRLGLEPLELGLVLLPLCFKGAEGLEGVGGEGAVGIVNERRVSLYVLVTLFLSLFMKLGVKKEGWEWGFDLHGLVVAVRHFYRDILS